MAHPIDVEKFRVISRQPRPSLRRSPGLPLPVKRERFFAGPIPWSWWSLAARQPGKSLQVATAIWHIGAMKKSGRVQLQSRVLRELGVSRKSVYRVLKNFEQVGLIQCERGPGRGSVITVLAISDQLNGNGKESDMSGETG